MNDGITDKNKHVDNRGQCKQQPDVIMSEERFYTAQRDTPPPSIMIAIPEINEM